VTDKSRLYIQKEANEWSVVYQKSTHEDGADPAEEPV
jgi:hypothetical protein